MGFPERARDARPRDGEGRVMREAGAAPRLVRLAGGRGGCRACRGPRLAGLGCWRGPAGICLPWRGAVLFLGLLFPLLTQGGRGAEGEESLPVRWKFHGAPDSAEQRRRGLVRDQIGVWWRDFEEQRPRVEAYLRKESDWDLPAWINGHLRKIEPRLTWDIGPALEGQGQRLVITAASRRGLTPLVRELVAAAPVLPGWEFYSQRQAERFHEALVLFKARARSELSLLQFCARTTEFHSIELAFRAPHFRDPADPVAREQALLAAELCLGEQTLNCWISRILVEPVEDGAGAGEDGAFRPVRQLNAIVHHLIRQVRDELPAETCASRSERQAWTLYTLEPPRLADYPRQDDLFTGTAMLPELFKSFHSGKDVDSERFSRFNETFCFLKIDASDPAVPFTIKERNAFEELLHLALLSQNVGCHIGGGTGYRYFYIDLALTDLEKGLAAIRREAARFRFPRRSWILFFDADLQYEWLGFQDDTPAPPLPEPE